MMKTLIGITLTMLAFLYSCGTSSNESVVNFEQGSADSSSVLIVKQHCFYEDLAAYFVLVSKQHENDWELMAKASKEITSMTYDKHREVEKVIIMYYNDETIIPASAPTSKSHAMDMIGKSLILASITKDKIVGYTEAEDRKSSSEVIQYPVKVLQNKAAKGITN